MRFRVGQRVQARVKHDRMFYTGTVVALHPASKGSSRGDEIEVLYDDDDDTSRIPACWAVPGDERNVIFRSADSGPAAPSSAVKNLSYASSGDKRASGAAQRNGGHEAIQSGGGGVLVTQSTMWAGPLDARAVSAGCGPRPARLLSFVASPKVYQSGVIVGDGGELCWEHIFEPEQALALALALLETPLGAVVADAAGADCAAEERVGGIGGSSARADIAASTVCRRVAIIGGGGGTLAMALRSVRPRAQPESAVASPQTNVTSRSSGRASTSAATAAAAATLPSPPPPPPPSQQPQQPVVSQDVVELDPRVLEAAHACFGLPRDDALLRVHACDGAAFVARAAEGCYDVVLVDAVAADAADGAALELPPPTFVSDAWLRGAALRALRPGGVLAVNVIGDAGALARVVNTLVSVFGGEGRVRVLATDPNYYFYARKGGCGGAAAGDGDGGADGGCDGSGAARDAVGAVAGARSDGGVDGAERNRVCDLRRRDECDDPGLPSDPAEVTARALAAGLGGVCVDALAHDVAGTERYREEEVLIGWLTVAEFLARMEREVV